MRVAFFPDSFHEANGVGTLSREFAAFALRQRLPFLTVHSGPRTRVVHRESSTTVELKRGPASFALDHDLDCDPLLSRYKRYVTSEVKAFRPDLIHITGPGDMGILGFWVAHTLGIPLVASWHTNLHEYAARRFENFCSFMPDGWRNHISEVVQNESLRACVLFYRLARFILAPNEKMLKLLVERTGKPGFLMPHGVDTEVYTPAKRRRAGGAFCIGYVGRLTPEKNVRMFTDLQKRLWAAGERDFELILVGEGSEKEWLRKNLSHVELPGVLRGDGLAEAFAGMDVFVFPSRTDTFGLVLLEAMSSGLPVVVNADTGRHVGIEDGVEGLYAEDTQSVANSVLALKRNEGLRARMSCAARGFAISNDWSEVFKQLYRVYECGLEKDGRVF